MLAPLCDLQCPVTSLPSKEGQLIRIFASSDWWWKFLRSDQYILSTRCVTYFPLVLDKALLCLSVQSFDQYFILSYSKDWLSIISSTHTEHSAKIIEFKVSFYSISHQPPGWLHLQTWHTSGSSDRSSRPARGNNQFCWNGGQRNSFHNFHLNVADYDIALMPVARFSSAVTSFSVSTLKRSKGCQ